MSERPASVALFVTCVADIVEPDAAVAVVRVLRSAGCDVSVPEGQTCCGQPAWNSGFVDEAAMVAGTSLDALEADDAEAIVVPAGSCATMMRLYWPQLFELAGRPDDASRARAVGDRLFEFTELVSTLDLPPMRGGAERAIYHQSCHMLRELHVVDQPREMLDLAGCAVEEWPLGDQCCGFGGTFSVKLPEVSGAMADEKLDAMPAGVQTIVGADSSCLMQLRTRAEARGDSVTTVHIAQVLEASIARAATGTGAHSDG